MLGDDILKELCYEIILSFSISYGTTSLITSLIGAFIRHPLAQAYADYLPLLSACFESKYWEETIVGSYVAFFVNCSSAVVFLCA
jgi:hypothetical protein